MQNEAKLNTTNTGKYQHFGCSNFPNNKLIEIKSSKKREKIKK